MTSFVAKGTSYQAEPGYYDDLTMTLVLFSWVALQPYFKEMNDVDIRKRLYDEKVRVMEDEMLPFGFTDDGVSVEDKYIDNDGTVWSVVDPWIS